MRKGILIALSLWLVGHAGLGAPLPDKVVPVKAVPVVEGLEVVWDFVFLPDGKMLITERPGRLVLADPKSHAKKVLAALPVWRQGEGGLMGMALSPDYPKDPGLFLCYTYQGPKGPLNRVSRFVFQNRALSREKVLVDGMRGNFNHNGCRLVFGPDKLLYITMGESGTPALAQKLDNLNGKVLRVAADGSIPASNPFPGSAIFTYGHRNPQGLSFHPVTRQPYISEHGENTDDEINLLVAGKNYGWPKATGSPHDPAYEDALFSWTPTLATSGAVFYTGDKIPAWKNDFFIATLKASRLERIVFKAPAYREVIGEEVLFNSQLGRLRALRVGPDGYLYVGTSSRDGRGRPLPGDDKIYRIVPGQ